MYYTRIWSIRASLTAVRSYNRLFHNLVRIIWFEVRSDMSNKHIGINCVLQRFLGELHFRVWSQDTFIPMRFPMWRRQIIVALFIKYTRVQVDFYDYTYTTVILEDDLPLHREYLYARFNRINRDRFSYCTTQWLINYLRCFRAVLICTLCNINCKRSLPSESQSK